MQLVVFKQGLFKGFRSPVCPSVLLGVLSGSNSQCSFGNFVPFFICYPKGDQKQSEARLNRFTVCARWTHCALMRLFEGWKAARALQDMLWTDGRERKWTKTMAGYVQALSVLGPAATESPEKHALNRVHQEHEYFSKATFSWCLHEWNVAWHLPRESFAWVLFFIVCRAATFIVTWCVLNVRVVFTIKHV